MAGAIGFLLRTGKIKLLVLCRLLLFSLLAIGAQQASAASAGIADKHEDRLVTGFETSSNSYDTGDDSLWTSGPLGEDLTSLNETSSYNSSADYLLEAKTQNRYVTKHQNLSSHSQKPAAESGNQQQPRSCPPTEVPQNTACETLKPQQLVCPTQAPQQPKHVPLQIPHLLWLLKGLSNLPEIPKENQPPPPRHQPPPPQHQPPHNQWQSFLPKWLHGIHQSGYLPKWLLKPQQHGNLPKWPNVPYQHDDYQPFKPDHYGYPLNEHQHHGAGPPQPYGFQLWEPQPHGYPPVEFKETQQHHYPTWKFQEPHPQQQNYPLREPQSHPYPPQEFHESQQRGYPLQVTMKPKMPHQQDKQNFKPQGHRMSRYMARWPNYLPQRPHYLVKYPQRPQYKPRPGNVPHMFYYKAK